MLDPSTPMRDGNREDLNSPPPVVKTKSSILDSVKASDKGGIPAQNPQMMALAGFGMIKQGARMLGISVPEAAGPLQQMVMQLEQALPQMLTGSFTGAGAVAAPPPPQANPQGMMPQA